MVKYGKVSKFISSPLVRRRLPVPDILGGQKADISRRGRLICGKVGDKCFLDTERRQHVRGHHLQEIWL